MMKKVFLCLAFCMALFSSCTQESISRQLENADSLLQYNPYVADSILSSIDTFLIRTDKNHAYYGLLSAQTRFLLHKKVAPSELDFSISFYKEHHQDKLLHRSYLYRAYINEYNKGSLDSIVQDFLFANHSLAFEDSKLTVLYKKNILLADSFVLLRQFDSAYFYKACADSLYSSMKDKQLVEEKFISKNSAEQIKTDRINLVLLILILLVVLFNLTMILLKRYIKNKKNTRQLLEDFKTMQHDLQTKIVSTNEPLQAKISSLQKLLFKHQRTINELNVQISQSHSDLSSNVRKLSDVSEGIKWLFYVLNNETELDFNKSHILQFIECYRLLDDEFVIQLEQAELTPKEKLFCILHRLDKTPQQIILMLDMTKDSYRQIKSRTLKKLTQYGKLDRFCDKIE